MNEKRLAPLVFVSVLFLGLWLEYVLVAEGKIVRNTRSQRAVGAVYKIALIGFAIVCAVASVLIANVW